ncbi:MAG: asparagine synthase-related protein, partial [Polyangiaceae bacterium]
MAFIFAGLGHVRPDDWARFMEEETGERSSPLAADQCERGAGDARMRLCAIGREATIRDLSLPDADLVAAGSGALEGDRDVAPAVLDAYRLAGVSGLAGLRGEYAFALWDGRERSLLVGCDAVGLRAPAYVWDGQTFLASSRATALLRFAQARRGWDRVYLADALSGLSCRTAAATAFAGVRRMMGGEILRVSRGGVERLAGDRLVFDAGAWQDREGAARELGGRLDRVVRAKADVRRSCVALSGGVDSCAVASSMARHSSVLDAFALVGPDGSPAEPSTLSSMTSAIAGLRLHRVPLPADITAPLDSKPLTDDPIWAGPGLQAGRVAILRAARGLGFERIFDGEGGDELFDLAWRPADMAREFALAPVLSALRHRGAARRMARDLVMGGSLGPLSDVWLRRVKRQVRERRSWLLPDFWRSPELGDAWRESRSFGVLRSARERLPEILGAHASHWRNQSLARRSAGLDGASPLLDRSVVELVGSLPAHLAMDPLHRKALLR